jgi:zinc protease
MHTIDTLPSLDRTQAPAFGKVSHIDLAEPTKTVLGNGIPVHYINAGTQDLIKIEFIFKAGKWFEQKKLVAHTVGNMISEGTSKFTAAEIADKIDFYGAFLQSEVTDDTGSVCLFTLTKYLEQTLETLYEVLTDATFPQHELHTYIQNQQQKLKVNNERVDYIARKHLNQSLFGAKHPYGYYSNESDYGQLTREDLLDFYTKYYKNNTYEIIASGHVDASAIAMIEKYFGKDKRTSVADNITFPEIDRSEYAGKKDHLPKKDALQAAIRIGRPLLKRTHLDYQGMQVLNTILGGYFGSRLMANIREDKGYTYGIGSGVGSLLKQGYFFISTEVGADISKDAVKEIFAELKRLREELVPQSELQLVKNYMMGSFLRSIDGPFALADKYKTIAPFGLGYEYYDKLFETINTITPEQIQTLANKYFKEEDLYGLVVG